MKLGSTIPVLVAAFLVVTSCSSGSDETSKTDVTDSQAQVGSPSTDSQAPGTESSSGGGGGTLDLDGTTIELTSARCYLEGRDAPTGGKILFTAQGNGVDASGEELLLDVARYDDESVTPGDLISIEMGAVGSPDAHSLMSIPGSKLDVLKHEGSSIHAADVDLIDDGNGDRKTVSFKIEC